MPGGIKIINILKGDHFDEVFEEFKQAEAEEVILIFPKNSYIAKDEAHFVSLAGAAQDTGKTITIMTADEKVRSYSQKFGFKFLASPGKSFNNDEEAVEEVTTDELDEEESKEPEKEDDEDSIEDIVNEDVEDGEAKQEADDNPEGADDTDLDVEDNDDEEEEDENEGLTDLAMAKSSKVKHTLRAHTADLLGSKKKTESIKKLENLESIWFKGEKEKSRSSRVWPNKLFIGSKKSAQIRLILLGGAVIALGLIFYFFLGSAQVVLKPQKQSLDFELNITASSTISQVDGKEGKIPGQLLTHQEEISKDFSATGQKEIAQKARGEITVYNNYNSEPQIFVATTRFESTSGLIFRTPRPVAIPGAKLVGGKLVPGSTVVEVLADKPGPAYNIEPSKFTVPGLKGSSKFDGFYAESAKTFTGGITGLSKVVTESDFNKAKEEVTKQVLEVAVTTLKSKANNLKITEPFDNQIISLKSTAEAEQASDGFAIKAVAKAKTIAFLESDVLELVRLYVSKDQEMVLLPDTLKITYKNTKPNYENSTISFVVTVRGQAAAKVDEDKIVGKMLGMKQGSIKDYLLSIKEIESAKVVLSPFWVKVVPKNRKDIKVQLVY